MLLAIFYKLPIPHRKIYCCFFTGFQDPSQFEPRQDEIDFIKENLDSIVSQEQVKAIMDPIEGERFVWYWEHTLKQ